MVFLGLGHKLAGMDVVADEFKALGEGREGQHRHSGKESVCFHG
jgi:hypothetical protein